MPEPKPQTKHPEEEKKPSALVIYRYPNYFMSKFSQKLRELGVKVEEVPISHEDFDKLVSEGTPLTQYLSSTRKISPEQATKIFTDSTIAKEWMIIQGLGRYEIAYRYLSYPETLEEFQRFLIRYKEYIEENYGTPIVFPFLLGDHFEQLLGKMNLSDEKIQEIIESYYPSDLIITEEDYRLMSEHRLEKYKKSNSEELGKIYTAILRSLGFEITSPSLFRPYGTMYKFLERLVYQDVYGELSQNEIEEMLKPLEDLCRQYEKPVLLVDHHVIVECESMITKVFEDPSSNPKLREVLERIKFMTICPCCIGGRTEFLFEEDGTFKKFTFLYGDLWIKEFLALESERFGLDINEENLRSVVFGS